MWFMAKKQKKRRKKLSVGGRVCVLCIFNKITGKDLVCGGGSIG